MYCTARIPCFEIQKIKPTTLHARNGRYDGAMSKIQFLSGNFVKKIPVATLLPYN